MEFVSLDSDESSHRRRFCFFNMSSMAEKSLKESSWGNIVKITQMYNHFLLLISLLFYGISYHISAWVILRSKINIPLDSSQSEQHFGTKSNTQRQNINEL